MTNLHGKWVFITGASRGVGYQIASFMAGQGCNLILHSRQLAHTEQIEKEARALGVETYRVGAELSDPDQVSSMLDEITGTNIPVDIIFNNAALQVPYRENYWETPIEDFEISFRTNFIPVTSICNRLIPKMVERGFGRIINTTSGIKNQPEQAAYSASKAALDKYTKDLASKLEGTDVIISLTDPGWVKTDLGGPNASHEVETVIPGIVVGAFVNEPKSGRFFKAQDYRGMSLEDAIQKAEQVEANPHVI